MNNKELIYRALIVWRNYIQTGDPALSTEMAIKSNQKEKCKILDIGPQQFVIRLTEAANDILNDNFDITK